MLYAIISEDVFDSLPKRQSVRSAHLQRLQELQDAGRLVLAGPHPAVDSDNTMQAGFTGSLIVAQFDSLAQALQWSDSDPYVGAGVYARVIVKPFKQIFPHGTNN